MELSRPKVEATPRKAMTPARKKRIRLANGPSCRDCGRRMWYGHAEEPKLRFETRFDHTIPLELGGSDDDDNIREICREPCDKIKTAQDQKDIARARRRQKRQLTGRGTKRKGPPLKSGGFRGHRKMNGDPVFKRRK